MTPEQRAELAVAVSTRIVNACARAAHEVNKTYCEALGDNSQPSWEDAPDWQRSSAKNGVAGALAGNSAAASHASWLEEKRLAGWKWGPVKNPEKKEHPCMVAYNELPPEQQMKDKLFLQSVQIMAMALGLRKG